MNEEDTVTVGQDLVKLELGGAPPEPKEKGPSEPQKDEGTEKSKEPAKAEEPKPSEPEKPKAPAAEKPAPPPKAPTPKAEPEPTPAVPGSREERRVGCLSFLLFVEILGLTAFSVSLGENEPDATSDCGAPEAVSEHGCLPHHLQRG